MFWLRWLAWALTAAYWGLLFAVTHMPPEAIQHAPHFWDKAEHFVSYFLLASLLGSALMLTFPERRGIPVWVLVIGMVYGVVDELLQPLVRRQADLNDWIADALGVWCGVFVLWALRKFLVWRGLMPGPRRRGFTPVTKDASPPAPATGTAAD